MEQSKCIQKSKRSFYNWLKNKKNRNRNKNKNRKKKTKITDYLRLLVLEGDINLENNPGINLPNLI